jgi:hypothetical protein
MSGCLFGGKHLLVAGRGHHLAQLFLTGQADGRAASSASPSCVTSSASSRRRGSDPVPSELDAAVANCGLRQDHGSWPLACSTSGTFDQSSATTPGH